MIPPRTTLITDWRTREEDLPDVAPGDECTRMIAPQTFIVLWRIIVRGMSLVSLRIGAVPDVPFALERADGVVHRYRLTGLDDPTLKERLSAVGAAVAAHDAIAISPLLEVCLQLRNEGAAPVKPRAALLVQQELSR